MDAVISSTESPMAMAEDTSDNCPLDGGCPTDYIATVVSSFVCGFILAATIVLYVKRDYPPLKAKQVPLMICQSVGSILWIISLVLSRNLFSFRTLPWSACSLWTVWIGGLFGFGLWISCHIARVYRLYYVFVGRRLPPLNSTQIVAILLLPWLVVAIVAESLRVFTNQNGLCEGSTKWDATVSSMMGVYAGMFIVGTWLVRNIRFAFNEYQDLKKATVVIILFVGIWCILYISRQTVQSHFTSSQLDVINRFTLVLVADVAALLFLWMPIVKSLGTLMLWNNDDGEDFLNQIEDHRRRRSSKSGFLEPLDLDLSDLDGPLELLLEHRPFLESFKKFAETRFAGECMHFFEMVRERKKLRSSSTVDRVYHATHIIDRFIRAGSPEEINISSAMRHEILSTSDLAGEHLFDNATKEIVKVMNMNLEKDYRKSPQFTSLKSRVAEVEEAREQLKRMDVHPSPARSKKSYRKSRGIDDDDSFAEKDRSSSVGKGDADEYARHPKLWKLSGPPSPVNTNVWKPVPGLNSPASGTTREWLLRDPGQNSLSPLSSTAQAPYHQRARSDFGTTGSPGVDPTSGLPMSAAGSHLSAGKPHEMNPGPWMYPGFAKGSNAGVRTPVQTTDRSTSGAGGARKGGGGKRAVPRVTKLGGDRGKNSKSQKSASSRGRRLSTEGRVESVQPVLTPMAEANGRPGPTSSIDPESLVADVRGSNNRRSRGEIGSVGDEEEGKDLYPFVSIQLVPTSSDNVPGDPSRKLPYQRTQSDVVQRSSQARSHPLSSDAKLEGSRPEISKSRSARNTNSQEDHQKQRHRHRHHRANHERDPELGANDSRDDYRPTTLAVVAASSRRKGDVEDGMHAGAVPASSSGGSSAPLLQAAGKANTDRGIKHGDGRVSVERLRVQRRGDVDEDSASGGALSAKVCGLRFPSFGSSDSQLETPVMFKPAPFRKPGEEKKAETGSGKYDEESSSSSRRS